MMLRSFGAGVVSTVLRSSAGTSIAAGAAANSLSLAVISLISFVSFGGAGGSSSFSGGDNS